MQRAYQEINDFEEQLCEHGVVLLKFWIHLSPDEQLRRFKERETTPWKGHKITAEDWRNRERWDDYKTAVRYGQAYQHGIRAVDPGRRR
jgi:polyphosphate kinase 2 (PPK2 family)